MSEPPDYVVNVPSTPDVHTAPAPSAAWESMSEDQRRALRSRLVESILQTVTQALAGLFVPTGETGGAFSQLQDWANDVRDDIFGVDGALQDLKDKLTGFADSTDTELDNWIFGLLGIGSPIPLSSIVNIKPNLYPDPKFASTTPPAVSVGAWVRDPDVRYGSTGASYRLAAATANENIELQGVPVAEGQKLSVEIKARWADLVGSGDIVFDVVYRSLSGEYQDEESVDTYAATAGTQSSWLSLRGEVVVPAGMETAVLRVSKPSTITGGSLYISSPEFYKSTTAVAPISFVSGLPDALDAVSEFVQMMGKTILEIITGLPFIGWLFEDIEEEMGGWFDDTQVTAGEANDALGNSRNTITNIVEAVFGWASTDSEEERTALDEMWGTAWRADRNVIDVQASVQQLVDENNAGTTGNRNSVVFSGADGSVLTGFTVSPLFDDIVIRTNDVAGLKSGLAHGRYWAVFDTTQYATDDQSVSCVLGDKGAFGAGTLLLNRSDPTLTNGAYCLIYNDQLSVGYYTRSGSTWTLNAFAQLSRDTGIGARIEFRSIGTNYYALVNGTQVLAVTDTGNNVTVGATNRTSGFSLSQASSLFGTVYSFWLSSFAMADYAPGGVSTVPSWHLTRDSTVAVGLSLANGAVDVLPAGFLTLQDSATGVEVQNLGQGRVKILQSDWYELDAAIMARPSAAMMDYWFAPYWAVFKNTVQVTGPISMGVSKKMYLAENDVVQVGLVGIAALPSSVEADAHGETTVGKSMNISSIKGFASFSGKLIP